jgi:predicted thioesterase
MKPGFLPGIVREVTVEVTDDMCPSFDGVVVHRCCSTWSLVHQMEIASRGVLVDFLDEHEEGIGAHVSVDHLAPCPVGRSVRVLAELIEVTSDHHPRVICVVRAYDGDRLLARGRQVQVVMSKAHLARYMERS